MVKRMRNAWQKQDIKQAIESNLQGFFGVKVEQATQQQLYKAVATLVQDHIMENWARSEEQVHARKMARNCIICRWNSWWVGR